MVKMGMSSWIYGGKSICKNVSITTFKSIFERSNEEYVIGGADMNAYIGEY
jgi:hypothetical protein